ncbi:hypothetical protein [Knoellia subterranea]|uniref:Lipoprotein n=1 Tax=Knoellia subterranea KCTC 19937 TaxID=1385521 RepID=A0A0A0JHF3_9MICO|nr:hypothetical protein [Knoellia subterranea]KGN36528.1 hypothetical protein N803_04310 [Knoellia subterranea KCTC 19937]
MKLNRSLTAALALSLTAVLGACGSNDAGTTDTKSTTGSTAKSDGAAQGKVGDEVDLSAFYGDIATAMKEKKSYRFTGDSAAGKLSGQMRVDGDKTAMRMETTVDGEAATILFVDGVMYMGGMDDLPAGKTFIKIDPKGDDPMSKMMGPALSQMAESADPTAALADLEGLKAKVVEVKDGTTTYEMTVTAEQQQKLAAEKLKDMGMDTGSLPTPSTAPAPMVVRQTIGADNLPTVVKITGSPEATMTITYSGWGEDVDVAAPPADKVATFSDMM